MTPTANSLCPCGSGKKYKRCCRSKDQGLRTLHQRLLAGELPFFARISSTEGEAGQFVANNASITLGGVTTVLIDEAITVSTNSTAVTKTEMSTAAISIPVDGTSQGSIWTSGNASVSNSSASADLALRDGTKKMKGVSSSGLYAIAQIKTQRDSGQQYFDLLFGTSGQAEEVDAEGVKQRPHIAIHPDGNGKFIRLAGHSCELESEMTYQLAPRQIVPRAIRVRSIEHQEVLELRFTQGLSGSVVLEEICFGETK